MTLTENTTHTLIGKTFEMFREGVLIGEGIVYCMVSPTHILLLAMRKEDGKEWMETRHLDEMAYDWHSKTGIQLSLENPRREALEE